MARRIFKLTDAACEKAKTGNKRRELPDGGGLYLVIHTSGLKTWTVRYRRDGRSRKYTVEVAYPTIGLKTARAIAQDVMRKVATGGDPASEKQHARTVAADHSTEFQAVAASFLSKVLTRGKSPRRPRFRTLEGMAASLGMVQDGENTWRPKGSGPAEKWKGRKVTAITKRDVLDHLDSMVAKGIRIQTNRALVHLRQFFGWCQRRDLVTVNPCANVDRLVEEKPRDRVLSDAELAMVWNASGEDDELFGPVHRMLILTGQRRGEVGGMEWTEIDWEARAWTIPGSRTKNHREHVVPLSAPAVAILKAQPRFAGSKYVFTLNGKTALAGFTRAKLRLDRNIPQVMKPFEIHDLRRTAATGMQKLAPPHVIELVLNHISTTFGGLVGVYQKDRLEAEKRALLDAWARHVMQITGNNVVRIAA